MITQNPSIGPLSIHLATLDILYIIPASIIFCRKALEVDTSVSHFSLGISDLKSRFSIFFGNISRIGGWLLCNNYICVMRLNLFLTAYPRDPFIIDAYIIIMLQRIPDEPSHIGMLTMNFQLSFSAITSLSIHLWLHSFTHIS